MDVLRLGPSLVRRDPRKKPKYETKLFKQLRQDGIAAMCKAAGLNAGADEAEKEGQLRVAEYLRELAKEELATGALLEEEAKVEWARSKNARRRK